MVIQEAPADVCPSTEPISMKSALATAQCEGRKALDQLALLQQKRDIMKINLQKGSFVANVDLETKTYALRDKAMKAKKTLDHIRLPQSK